MERRAAAGRCWAETMRREDSDDDAIDKDADDDDGVEGLALSVARCMIPGSFLWNEKGASH